MPETIDILRLNPDKSSTSRRRLLCSVSFTSENQGRTVATRCSEVQQTIDGMSGSIMARAVAQIAFCLIIHSRKTQYGCKLPIWPKVNESKQRNSRILTSKFDLSGHDYFPKCWAKAVVSINGKYRAWAYVMFDAHIIRQEILKYSFKHFDKQKNTFHKTKRYLG